LKSLLIIVIFGESEFYNYVGFWAEC